MLLTYLIHFLVGLLFIWTVWPTIREHDWRQRKEAFTKCIVIWFFSTLPVFFSIVATTKDDFSANFVFFDLSGSPFSWSEQLVYSSTFLAPVIYSFVEALKIFSSDRDSNKKRYFKRVFSRYSRVLVPSVILLLVSMFVFTAIKTDEEAFRQTIFYDYMQGRSIFIYLVSWAYWYCIVLIENVSGEDYSDVVTAKAKSFTDAARARLGDKYD